MGSIPYKAGTTLRIGDNTVTAVLATINQVDPIFVSFAMPQVYLPDLRAAMAKGEVKVNAGIDEKRKQSGAMAFIENTVDPNTGTVTGKAKIANANEGLWPGQFVKAEIILGIEPNALAVPAAAVQLGPQGAYVFVIKDGNIAEVPPVVVAGTQNNESVIASGPETRAASVAAILEGQFSNIAGVTAMTSTSSLGNTSIVLQFDLNRNIDGAALDVQSQISAAMRRLPIELPTPPSFRKVNPADFPILFLPLKSSQLRLSDIAAFPHPPILPP